MRTKRIIFKDVNEVDFEEVELPEPSENQLLIETSKTLISTGTELTVLTGEFPKGSYWDDFAHFPFVPGYSNVGRVIERGDQVEETEIGERVACYSPHSQYTLVEVDERMEEADPSDRLAIPKGVVKLSENISDEVATFHNLAITALNSVRLANISLGDSVVIMGAGLVGQLAIVFSRLAGAYPVISAELSEMRIKMARDSGANATVKADEEDLEERINDLTDCRGADIVFEVTGNSKVIPQVIRLVKPQGKLVILSSPRGKTELDFHDMVNAPSRIIQGTHISSHPEQSTPYNPWTARRNTELFLEYLSDNIIELDHLISHRYHWSDAEKAYQKLLDDRTKTMGIILEFDKEHA